MNRIGQDKTVKQENKNRFRSYNNLFYLSIYYSDQNGASVLYAALLALIDRSNGSGIGSGNIGLGSLSEGSHGSRLTKVSTQHRCEIHGNVPR